MMHFQRHHHCGAAFAVRMSCVGHWSSFPNPFGCDGSSQIARLLDVFLPFICMLWQQQKRPQQRANCKVLQSLAKRFRHPEGSMHFKLCVPIDTSTSPSLESPAGSQKPTGGWTPSSLHLDMGVILRYLQKFQLNYIVYILGRHTGKTP